LRLTLAPAEAAPCVAELNVPGAFRGRIIQAESIGQSSDDLSLAEPPVVSLS